MNRKEFFPLKNATAVSIALTFMILAILYGSWIARLPDIKIQLNLSESEVGLALMGLAVGSLAAMPITVYILKYMHVGKATFVSTLFACGAFMVPAYAQGKWTLFMGLTLCGLTEGFMNIAMNTAGTSFENTSGKKILSTCHGMFSVGLVIGALASGLFANYGFPFPEQMLGIGAAMMVFAFFLRSSVEKVADVEEKDSGFVFPPAVIVGLGIICVCFNIGEGAIADWSGIYLRENIGSDPFTASLGLAIFSTGMAIGRFNGDWIRQIMSSRKILLAGGFIVLFGLSFVVLTNLTSTVIFGFFATGLGLSVAIPILYSESTQIEGVQPSVGLASLTTFSLVGFMCGPPFIGFIAEEIGLRGGFSFLLFLAAFGTFLVFKRMR